MARVRVIAGAFANFEGELVADEGDRLRIAVDIFGRRTEIEVEREQTDAAPLDPVVLPELATVLDELERWMQAKAPEVLAAHARTDEADLHALASLGPGARDLVELYRRFGGTTDWVCFFEGCELVPLRAGFSIREMMNGLESEGAFYRWMPNEWWNPGWLPFLDNHSYDMYCVDLTGTMGGVPGQIVRFSKDSASRSILAPSLAAWLGALIVGRDAGYWIWDPEEGIRVAEAHRHEEHRFMRRVLPGYPKDTAARSRKDALGAEPPPKPPQRVEASGIEYRVSRQQWAPGSTSVHALAFLPHRELLAVGQYDWGEAPGGLSLIDPSFRPEGPASADVVESVLGRGEGSALEVVSVGSRLVIRRMRNSSNEVLVMQGGGELQLVKGGLPTRMPAFIAVGDEHLAIAGEHIEIYALGEPCSLAHRTQLSGDDAVLGLSPDGALLVVARRDQPLRWYDVASGRQLGQTEAPVLANRIELGLRGDAWVASNRESLRFDLETGQRIDHDAAFAPFVIALHRPTRRIAFAGYGGTVVVLDAETGKQLATDSTHGCRVYGLAWDPTGTRLWSADEGGQIVERTVGA